MLIGFLGSSESVRRVHELEVGERLREVANLALTANVVLLGQQAEVVAQAQEVPEQILGIPGAANAHQGVYEPEGASEEGRCN